MGGGIKERQDQGRNHLWVIRELLSFCNGFIQYLIGSRISDYPGMVFPGDLPILVSSNCSFWGSRITSIESSRR